MPKLRRSAKVAPMCFVCGEINFSGTCVLMHANWPEYGKGVGLKVHDVFGAIGCQNCHDRIDGRKDNLPVEERKALWLRGHIKTLAWWIENRLLRAA